MKTLIRFHLDSEKGGMILKEVESCSPAFLSQIALDFSLISNVEEFLQFLIALLFFHRGKLGRYPPWPGKVSFSQWIVMCHPSEHISWEKILINTESKMSIRALAILMIHSTLFYSKQTIRQIWQYLSIDGATFSAKHFFFLFL